MQQQNNKESHIELLKYFKVHKNISMIICFVGIIGFYSYYSYLQEYLYFIISDLNYYT